MKINKQFIKLGIFTLVYYAYGIGYVFFREHIITFTNANEWSLFINPVLLLLPFAILLLSIHALEWKKYKTSKSIKVISIVDYCIRIASGFFMNNINANDIKSLVLFILLIIFAFMNLGLVIIMNLLSSTNNINDENLGISER